MLRSASIVAALWFLTSASGLAQSAGESVEALTNQVRALRRGGYRTEGFTRTIAARSEAFRSLMRSEPRRAVGAGVARR